jgi:hypothetical protein
VDSKNSTAPVRRPAHRAGSNVFATAHGCLSHYQHLAEKSTCSFVCHSKSNPYIQRDDRASIRHGGDLLIAKRFVFSFNNIDSPSESLSASIRASSGWLFARNRILRLGGHYSEPCDAGWEKPASKYLLAGLVKLRHGAIPMGDLQLNMIYGNARHKRLTE